ncbi:MAG: hypothetical protein ACJ780_10335 [Solirubrobacteraceae bacterium]
MTDGSSRVGRCADCGAANPELVGGVCAHRYACEARQMLAVGVPAHRAAAHAQRGSAQAVDDAEIAEALKDAAFILGLSALRATRPTGPDAWTTIAIRHPSALEDAADGWVTTISYDAL